ncbi:MAG: hypothetical protein IPM84_08470 [Anaerolineae bacterium]|nr:hypothetical protein [Anaerolineae bacterium]
MIFHPAQPRLEAGRVPLLGADVGDGLAQGVGLTDAVHRLGPMVEKGDAQLPVGGNDGVVRGAAQDVVEIGTGVGQRDRPLGHPPIQIPDQGAEFAGHFVEGFGHIAKLVARQHWDGHIQLSGIHFSQAHQ